MLHSAEMSAVGHHLARNLKEFWHTQNHAKTKIMEAVHFVNSSLVFVVTMQEIAMYKDVLYHIALGLNECYGSKKCSRESDTHKRWRECVGVVSSLR